MVDLELHKNFTLDFKIIRVGKRSVVKKNEALYLEVRSVTIKEVNRTLKGMSNGKAEDGPTTCNQRCRRFHTK